MLEKRAHLGVGRQQAHQFRSELWVACAGVVDERLARGWLLHQRLVEDRPKAPISVRRLTHWRIFAAPSAGVNTRGPTPIVKFSPVASFGRNFRTGTGDGATCL